VEIDFATIDRGYALDRMGILLRDRGARRALLSAGRDSVLAIGGKGRGWPVDLRPLPSSRRVGRLWIKDGAVGTSAGEPAREIVGRRHRRVIDPRSGRPADGVLGASVIAGDAATADALSRAFLIGGPQLAEEYCAAYPEVLAVLALDQPGERTQVFGRYTGATLEMLT
jgi:thiamine biosynthesis lipoprotein